MAETRARETLRESTTNRRRFIKGLGAGALAACATPLAEELGLLREVEAAVRHPNLLFVFADQMRGQALGFLNEDPVMTPSLDRFAAESVVFTQAASNYPVCSPYRAMLMTGKYPLATGVLANCNSNGSTYGYELQEKDRCWSDVLKEKGYSLGYIGKWHLDAPQEPYVKSYNNREDFAWNEWCPPRRRHGFDFWYSYGTFDRHMAPEYWSTNMTRDERVKVKQYGPEHEADLAIKYVRNEAGEYREAGRPFALVVSNNPPHTPYDAVPDRYVRMYGDSSYGALINRPNVDLEANTRAVREAKNQIKNYFAQVTGVDDQLGRILEALKDEGLEKDTIVVFTSDHGNCIGSHDCRTKNVHYEESMRVPFIMRWPGVIRPRHDDLLISSPDIYPTLLDLMGFADDVPQEVEGVSHASILVGNVGKRPTSQPYYWIPLGRPALGRRGVRTHRYTLMMQKMPEKPVRTVLHDNVEDPYQLRNIADGKPGVVRDLVEGELNPWLRKTGDPWLGSL